MIEIERKYLVHTSQLPDLNKFKSKSLLQGYLQSDPETTIRVRTAGELAHLTIKGKSENLTRKEFEYEIPMDNALELLKLCGDKVITKVRYFIPSDNRMWELDFFTQKLEGLILAEIELEAENEQFEKPEWIAKEVSLDHQFFNSNLSALTAAEASVILAKIS